MSGQSVQGLLPAESFGLLGVSKCGVARWKILALFRGKSFYGPPPCLLDTNLTRDSGPFECLRVCKIKCTQSPAESPEMLGICNFSRLVRLKLQKQHYFNQLWDSRI